MNPDLIVPGGWYADSRPDRTYAATIWHSNQTYTHWGVLPNPSGDAPLWLAVSVAGNRIAAQGQNDPPKGWEFDGAQWNETEAPCGVWPVIYDAANVLRISHCQPGVGSQGWRYVAPDGHLVTGDSTIAVRHGLNERTDLSLAQDGSFEVGQCNDGAGAGVWIGGKLRVFSPGACFVVRGKWDILTNVVSLCCYNVASDGVESRLYWTTPEALLALPPVAESAPPIGPLVPSRTDTGTAYDLLPFVLGDPATFPRKGPTHPMHQVIEDGAGIFHFVKFGDQLPKPYVPGEAYETWARDANWIYHLEDASAEPYHFSDPRWYPRQMRIGEAHCFDSGEHEIVFTERKTCRVWRRDPVIRRMWVQALYDRFYCGPDLGERAVLVVAYDPSASRIDSHGNRVGIPGRSVELGFYALGAGSFRWESHAATKVYRTGSPYAQFSPASLAYPPSDFYLFGGPALQPKLTGCVAPVVPSYPAWEPKPPMPERFPPIKGMIMTTERGWLIGPGDKALSMDSTGKVTFDFVDLSEVNLLQLDPIAGDRRGTFRPVAHLDRYLTADATQFAPGGNPCLAYYGALVSDVVGPDGLPGWYQRWDVGIWASGLVTALVPYIEQGANHGRVFASPSLTWVKQ